MFNKARIKLTAWYLLVIMLISISFSAVINNVITNEIIRASHFQQVRFERQFNNMNFPPPPLDIDQDIIDEVHRRLLIILVIVNSGIFVVSGALGYFLAGLTLKPIKEMVDEQNRFISDSSHELRTPLTSLKTSMEVALMNKSITVSEARDLIKENIEDVNKLQVLSDDLLKLAQFENKSNHIFERLAIKDIFDQSIKSVSPLAQKKKINIKVISKDLHLPGIKTNLVELFTIILDNAIKYSPEKTSIEIVSKRLDGHLKIIIKDEGIGIDKKDLSHIFDRFYRADSARSKNDVTGYGLGLSIAKKIVDLHHGNISAISEVDKGTQFIIKLPI